MFTVTISKPSPRILIVRLSAIGDVIQAMPLASALRDRYPDARLAWVVGEPAADLLRGHAALDEVFPVPRGFLKSPSGLWRLRKRLRAFRPDVVLEAQGLTKSALVGWLSSCRRRIGFRGVWGRELSPWLNTRLVDGDRMHVVDRNLALLGPLGIDRPEVRFDVPLDEADRRAADRILAEADLTEPLAIINPGAGWASKLWPPERFAAVARHLGETWDLPSLVVWAGEDERCRAERIVTESALHSRLAPPTTLRELAALSTRAVLFISSDTGPLHLAAAVGAPCVGLFGPWPVQQHGPYGPRHIALQGLRIDRGTRQRRRASSRSMEAISVQAVCEACDTILHRDHWQNVTPTEVSSSGATGSASAGITTLQSTSRASGTP